LKECLKLVDTRRSASELMGFCTAIAFRPLAVRRGITLA
jgi:hypothetical protein